MSMYLTGSMPPSNDPRDLDDNAKVLDLLLSSHAVSVPSRLGELLRTWWQIQQDAASFASPNVSSLAGLSLAVNKGLYSTGANTLALFDFPLQGRNLVAATTDQAQRTVLGIPWAGATTSTAVADANLVTTTSILGVSGSTTNVPAAFTSGSMLTTKVFNPTSMTQIVEARASDAVSYRRMVSGTWQPWVPFVLGGATMSTPLNNAPIVALASAATTSIAGASVTGNTVSITGTTTITSLGNVATTGIRRRLMFAAALTLTHNASSLIIPGAANVVTAAGDVCDVESVGVNQWRVCDYFPASGLPFGTQGFTALSLQNSWVAVAARRAAMRKIGDNLMLTVQISGGTATDGTALFTLPAGSIPPFYPSIPVLSGPPVTPTSSVLGPHVRIDTSTGVVSCWNCSSAAGIFFHVVLPLV